MKGGEKMKRVRLIRCLILSLIVCGFFFFDVKAVQAETGASSTSFSAETFLEFEQNYELSYQYLNLDDSGIKENTQAMYENKMVVTDATEQIEEWKLEANKLPKQWIQKLMITGNQLVKKCIVKNDGFCFSMKNKWNQIYDFMKEKRVNKKNEQSEKREQGDTEELRNKEEITIDKNRLEGWFFDEWIDQVHKEIKYLGNQNRKSIIEKNHKVEKNGNQDPKIEVLLDAVFSAVQKQNKWIQRKGTLF